VVVGKSGCRAKCKMCGKELQGIVAQMKHHFSQCQSAQKETEDGTPEVPKVNDSKSPEASSSKKRTAMSISDKGIPMLKKQFRSGGKMVHL